MATSPNFGWLEPDNTDLVKNGALAIRTAVNAIDASLAELKGGTTGQVLSKTSNTDMDFTWVAQDDSNAIQNAIVDAKGDLIAATANDTPARLAVGTNNAFLQAISTESTGLKWTYGLTSYTPSVASSIGSITSYTSSGYYILIGKMCFTSFNIKITNNGTGAGTVNFDLPTFNGANIRATGTTQETDVTGNNGIVYAAQNAISGVIVTQAGLYPGGTNYRLQGNLWFEAA
jgi:hypothetical protein